jgi:hypothetical protein
MDQFAISSMAATSQGTHDGRWSALLSRLEHLVQLQLVACPASLFHYEESVVWKFYEATREIYERLSAGLAFQDYEAIRRVQLFEHAKLWSGGKGTARPRLHLDDVLIGDRSAWQPRLEIQARVSTTIEEIEELRRLREEVASGMEEVFARWQFEKPSFETVFREEARAYGPAIIHAFARHVAAKIEAGEGHVPAGFPFAAAPSAALIIMTIRDALLQAGVAADEAPEKAYEYLLSGNLCFVPFNELSASLYAAIARKAAAGQKKLPTRGLANDIRMVSSLLPYCDAMFLDNECAAYLREAPLNELVAQYETRVFSLSSLAEFMQYLEDLRDAAPPEHLQLVADVYGM